MCTTLLIGLLLSGCSTSPEKVAVEEYQRSLTVLLSDNQLLEDEVMKEAAAAYNKTLPPAELATQWSSEIVPMAQQITGQASIIKPPASLKEPHAELVEIWQERASAFADMDESLKNGEALQWPAHVARAEAAIRSQAQWEQNIGAHFEPYGLSFPYTP